MMTAEPPVVANGVVFVLAAGEFTAQANDEEADSSAGSKDQALHPGQALRARCAHR